MAIEMYDKAKVVRMGGRLYFLLKFGSKNSYNTPNSASLDENFVRRYHRNAVRSSSLAANEKFFSIPQPREIANA